MRRRKRQSQFQPIGDILFSVLQKKGMASKLQENALLKLWSQAVGPQIASKTKPDSFKNGTLFVMTVSSVWVQQLHFMKEEILKKMNELSGRTVIREIRFLTGQILSPDEKSVHASYPPKSVLKKRDKEMIAECTEVLADQELASVLKRVMQLEISRRRRMENGKAR